MLSDQDREFIFQRFAAFIDAGPESETTERLARLCLALALRCETREMVEEALRVAEGDEPARLDSATPTSVR